MTNMTPEQEAAKALDLEVVQSDLPDDAQLAYDRLVEQRTQARAPQLPEPAGSCITILRWVGRHHCGARHSRGPGLILVLFPWLTTHFETGTPPWPHTRHAAPKWGRLSVLGDLGLFDLLR